MGPVARETALQADGRHGATAVRMAQSNLLAAAVGFLQEWEKIYVYCIELYIYMFIYREKYYLISICADEHYIYIPLYIHLCGMYIQYSDPATAIQLNLKPYDLIPKRW